MPSGIDDMSDTEMVLLDFVTLAEAEIRGVRTGHTPGLRFRDCVGQWEATVRRARELLAQLKIERTGYYVMAIGPADGASFIGPFQYLDDADHYAADLRQQHLDAYIMTADDMQENIREYGKAHICSPEDY